MLATMNFCDRVDKENILFVSDASNSSWHIIMKAKKKRKITETGRDSHLTRDSTLTPLATRNLRNVSKKTEHFVYMELKYAINRVTATRSQPLGSD